RFAEFGRLSSGIFHDLLNPINAIVLTINKLNVHSTLEVPELRTQLNHAIKASKQMEVFIRAIRKQIQTHGTHTTFSLNEEIEQVLDMISFKAREQQVDIRFEADEEIRSYGNALKFHQVITNLVINAIDAYDNKSL